MATSRTRTFSTYTGCSGTSSGYCTGCPSCSSGQYRAGCSGISSGSCTSCPSCSSGQYRTGCSGISSGSCTSCPSCSTGQYILGCSGISAGSCCGVLVPQCIEGKTFRLPSPVNAPWLDSRRFWQSRRSTLRASSALRDGTPSPP
jgi:hypothetical protein